MFELRFMAAQGQPQSVPDCRLNISDRRSQLPSSDFNKPSLSLTHTHTLSLSPLAFRLLRLQAGVDAGAGRGLSSDRHTVDCGHCGSTCFFNTQSEIPVSSLFPR